MHSCDLEFKLAWVLFMGTFVRTRSIRLSVITLSCLIAGPVVAQTIESSWRATTNSAADDVYHDNDKTLYCGCTYLTHGWCRNIGLATYVAEFEADAGGACAWDPATE
jgi:hypothetical protein